MAKLLQRRPSAAMPSLLPLLVRRGFSDASGREGEVSQPSREHQERTKRWLKLPPFAFNIDPSTLGKHLTKERANHDQIDTKTTNLKWVRRCCPGVPANLVQKLFRLRQVRKQVIEPESSSCLGTQASPRTKRVSANDILALGDVILLPSSVREFLPKRRDYRLNEDEVKYVRSLELYKDPDIIVVNKPQGLPVQGGNGIEISMDMLAFASLRYDYKEPPRLVHRLDRETSGILVMGRTATSTSILHSLFREKTSRASNDIGKAQRTLQKRYWALVIGKPKRSRGIISSPLVKVIVDNGKSERLTVSKSLSDPSQSAITEYQVIGSSVQGFTWLELCPLTGRKHQVRVHLAEVLGTPIVGDLKYGWFAQRKWEPLLPSITQQEEMVLESRNILPFGLGRHGGSICDKKPKLHLHCREMVLPNISMASKISRLSDLSRIGSLELVAPLPYHMQRSWDILEHTSIHT